MKRDGRKDRNPPIRIIRKRAHAGGHGGAWKVALADFMTAMFCLFLVLWLTNQTSDVKAAIAGYFQDPLGRADEHGSSILPGEGAQSASLRRPMTAEEVLSLRRDRLRSTAQQIQSALDESPELEELRGHIEIQLTDDGLRIELLEDSNGFFFDAGATRPNARGQRILALLGGELGKLTMPVQIEGHTDAYPISSGNGYTNWELSADRANAARQIMTANGLAPEQIAQVLALADRNPRVKDDLYSPSNRRVTITMLLGHASLESN